MEDEHEVPQRSTLEETRSSREALIALQLVYIENEKLYHQSNAFISQMHGYGELSMGRRSVLYTLVRGPQTVPQLAQTMSLSRQYIQKIINQLAEEEYVAFSENPAHKRSHFVQVSAKGMNYLRSMSEREMKIVALMVIDLPVEQLEAVAQGLQAIRIWQKRELGQLLASEQSADAGEKKESAP